MTAAVVNAQIHLLTENTVGIYGNLAVLQQVPESPRPKQRRAHVLVFVQIFAESLCQRLFIHAAFLNPFRFFELIYKERALFIEIQHKISFLNLAFMQSF